MRLGLRAQLLLGLTLVTLTVMVSVGWFALTLAERGLAHAQENLLALSASALAGGSLPPGGRLADGSDRLLKPAGEMRRATGIRELIYADQDKRVVAVARGPTGPRDGEAVAGTILEEPEAALALRSGSRVRADGKEGPTLYEPIRHDGRTVGLVRLRLAPASDSAAPLGKARQLLFWLTLVDGIILLGVGAFILGRYVVRPVEALSAAARRVAGGELGHVVTEKGAGEIVELARSFNQMSTALREQREQVVRSEKLASVGRLAAGVAHEVGNPLASVLGYTEMILSGQSTSEETRDHARRIRAETERIHRILTELLAYSRPPREEIEAVDVPAVVDAALSLLAPQPRMQGIEIARDVEPGLPLVAASVGRLTQVLVNLLLNAADAMSQRGRVTVGARVLGTDRVEIRVADTGPGVPEELRSRLFEPFFTTKEPGQGTGLGLAVCQSIVESLGGSIGLDRGTAAGATFVVTLPVWEGGRKPGG